MLYSAPNNARRTLAEHIGDEDGRCVVCQVPGPCFAADRAFEYLHHAGLPVEVVEHPAAPLLSKAVDWMLGQGRHSAPARPEPPVPNSRGWVSA